MWSKIQWKGILHILCCWAGYSVVVGKFHHLIRVSYIYIWCLFESWVGSTIFVCLFTSFFIYFIHISHNQTKPFSLPFGTYALGFFFLCAKYWHTGWQPGSSGTHLYHLLFRILVLWIKIHCWDAFQHGEVTQGTIGPVSSPAPVGCPRARDLLVQCDPPIIYGILWWRSG